LLPAFAARRCLVTCSALSKSVSSVSTRLPLFRSFHSWHSLGLEKALGVSRLHLEEEKKSIVRKKPQLLYLQVFATLQIALSALAS
jgi:hypothetical protein